MHPNFPGHLDLPGGEVEDGETIREAVSRELLEEVGISIEPNKLKEVFTKEYDEVTHTLFLLSIDSDTIAIRLSWEHKAYKWLTHNEIVSSTMPEGVDPYYTDFIEYLSS